MIIILTKKLFLSEDLGTYFGYLAELFGIFQRNESSLKTCFLVSL